MRLEDLVGKVIICYRPTIISISDEHRNNLVRRAKFFDSFHVVGISDNGLILTDDCKTEYILHESDVQKCFKLLQLVPIKL